MNLLQIPQMFNVDLRRNLFKFTSNSILLHLFPIRFRVALNGLNTKLPRAFNTSVFFHAITISTVIKLDLFIMSLTINFLQCRNTNRVSVIHVKLHMRRPLFTTLELPTHVASFRLIKELLQILLRKTIRVIASAQPN